MKSYLGFPFKSMSGKHGKLVYCCDEDGNIMWVREFVMPEITEHNHYMGNVSKQLAVFKSLLNPEYINDLKDYTDRYKLSYRHKCRPPSYSALLRKMMFQLKKNGYPVDLLTVTPQVVVDIGLPIRTVKEAIENELLPMIPRYDDLTHWIVE